MNQAGAMTETVKRIIKKHFGCDADEIGRIRNITNHTVYFFMAAGDCFFLKLYRSKEWPEEGKVPFVYQKLLQNNIPCAELIAYSREDEMYPDGYLIERKIEGTAADKIQLDREQETGFYMKLAELMSAVHSIRMNRFGYIGSGIADYCSITDFLEDEFDGFDSKLKGAVSEEHLKNLKEKVLHTMKIMRIYPQFCVMAICQRKMS